MPQARRGSWKPSWQPSGGGGGGAGGGKGGKGKGGKRGKGSSVAKTARRDVMLSIKPVRREIRRVRKQGIRDYKQAAAKTGSIYEALGAQLAPIGAQYTAATAGIPGQLTAQLGALGSTIGSTVPGVSQAELGGGANMLGALGGGAIAELASNASRNAAWQGSVQRQGAMEGTIAQRNMLQDLMGFKKDLGQQRVDLMRDVPALIRQAMTQRRDTNFERMLALRDLQRLEREGNRSFGLSSQSLAMQRQQMAADQAWLEKYYKAKGGV